MAPTRWPPRPLLLLFLFTAAAAAGATAAAEDASGPPPSPTPWPERFHAVMFTNLTNYSVASTGPPLRITDLYYDWPRRRNLNLVRHQLSADPLYDVEWNNGTSFYFDSSTCRVERFPVGVLPPWWLSGGGAEYMGRGVTGGIECHVWGKAGFIVYYEEAGTGRPVRWNFIDGKQPAMAVRARCPCRDRPCQLGSIAATALGHEQFLFLDSISTNQWGLV